MRSDYRQRTRQEGAERFSSQRAVWLAVCVLQLARSFALPLLLGWLLVPKLQQTYRAVDGNLEHRMFTLCEVGERQTGFGEKRKLAT